MTARQIRRAAERKQRKLQRKMNGSGAIAARSDEAAVLSEPKIQADDPAERNQRKQERKAANGFVFSSEAPTAVSDAQLAANHANSQVSTGPKTLEGKAKSCLDAVKSALTGRTVLLPTDDAAAYEHHVREYFKEFQPVGLRETSLVQALADTAWRLDRIPVLEMAIYAQGRIQFAEQFENDDAALRPGLIELHTYLAYEKQLKNLHIQEARLHRQRDKDLAELRRLQEERQKTAVGARHASPKSGTFQNGFEFSTKKTERVTEPLLAGDFQPTDHDYPATLNLKY